MNKENFTEKIIKRFYGIAGPLDEHKRREADRIGNICFIYLALFLLFGNTIAFLLAYWHPQAVGLFYPPLVELFISILFIYIWVQSK